MSLLSEVLSSAEEMELEQINLAVPKITQAIENCKSKVNSFLENVYVTFSDNSKYHRTLFNDATRLYNESIDLQNKLEHLSKKEIPEKEKEVEKLSLALLKVNIALGVLSKLRSIHEGLSRIKEYRECKMYVKAIDECRKVEENILSFPEDEKTIALEEMKIQCTTQKSKLLSKLSTDFQSNIKLHVNESDKVNTITVMKNSDEISEIIQALYIHTTAVFLLDEVSKYLWDHVFVPIVDHISEVRVDDGDTASVLEVIIKDTSKNHSYTEVFENLKKVMGFLKENFSYKVDDTLTALEYVAKGIRDALSELIIKHCLQNTIPSTNEGLEKYKTVIQDTEQLEKELIELHIFTEDTESILAYTKNIDIHFINKRCQEYLKTATSIMTKDLHNMKEVGTPYDPGNPLECLTGFTKCCVSKSVIDLAHFIEKILQEVVTSSEACAARLFSTVQKILEQYTTFVPEHHKKLLQTIPQQIALYHNNCLYLTEKIVEWSEVYSRNISEKLGLDPEVFRDNSYVLRTVATEMFSSYVQTQIKQIEEIMGELNLQNIQTLDKLEPSTEKCIRQCLRQQELLKTVWGKVLSYTVYNKTLGLILDSLCNLIINAIVKLEDIPSNVAEQLVDVLKIVVTRGPKLFTDTKEVSLYVPSWYKFNELVFVLNASLLDISDRWADGKGPLALQFKPDELKKLIRALFQNTDRRAAVLAKIV